MDNKVIRVFDNYVSNYDINNGKINKKYYHSLRVMKLCDLLANNFKNLTKEDINLLNIIGLFHDIGRFEQAKKYDTFDDKISFDHAKIGINILFKENLIEELNIKENNYELIEKAIFYHNKIDIPNNLEKKEKLFCELIRDADKIDIIKIVSDNKYSIENRPCEDIYNNFKLEKIIDNDRIINNTDRLLVTLGFIFDLNYEFSYKYLKEKDYLTKIFNNLKYENDDIKELFDEIKNIINNYINKKLGVENYVR